MHDENEAYRMLADYGKNAPARGRAVRFRAPASQTADGWKLACQCDRQAAQRGAIRSFFRSETLLGSASISEGAVLEVGALVAPLAACPPPAVLPLLAGFTPIPGGGALYIS